MGEQKKGRRGGKVEAAREMKSIAEQAAYKTTDTKKDDWLSSLLNKLDDGSSATMPEEAASDEADEDDGEAQQVPSTRTVIVTRHILSQKDLFRINMASIISLATKSNFCTIEVTEETWPEYKEFMFKQIRKSADSDARKRSRISPDVS
ncbi:hypothetical protein BgAZ_305890 [Babesia gibsoni]|uniref:Uncharacterized protein n=1 Tax=Babesia gibsoni TaxID=33632 RepID=A0AAD8PE24_BABGI|nr:hypothetical protein BgAZ_305890 [Babesia gibsoni]